MCHELLSQDRKNGRATGQPQGVGLEAYLNGTPQGTTPEDARKDAHIRGRSRLFMRHQGLGRCLMSEEKSPCLQCERVNKSKNECAGSCEKLDRYKEGLPFLSLWRGNPACYAIPGLERARSYPGVD
jgi:hypothetical protein